MNPVIFTLGFLVWHYLINEQLLKLGAWKSFLLYIVIYFMYIKFGDVLLQKLKYM